MAADEPDGTSRQLANWLLERVPAIRPTYDDVRTWTDPDASSYAMFAFVLRTYIDDLIRRHNPDELHRVFDLLEHPTVYGDLDMKNHLRIVVCEELNTWEIAPFLGERLRSWVLDDITYIPGGSVLSDRYRQRWLEEIEKIGGLARLTIANQLFIRYRLVKELGISGIRELEPGGRSG